jgi:nucleoside-diphosphate-sugar epimerase
MNYLQVEYSLFVSVKNPKEQFFSGENSLYKFTSRSKIVPRPPKITEISNPKKKICIFDCSSFLSGHLIQTFLKLGFDVKTTNNAVENCQKTFPHLMNLSNCFVGNLEIFPVDWNEPISIEKAIKGCEYVVYGNHSNEDVSNEEMMTKSINKLQRVLDSCKILECVKKFIFVSNLDSIFDSPKEKCKLILF